MSWLSKWLPTLSEGGIEPEEVKQHNGEVEVHNTLESETGRKAVIDELDATPNDELRELVADIREFAEVRKSEGAGSEPQVYNQCADLIEELVDDE